MGSRGWLHVHQRLFGLGRRAIVGRGGDSDAGSAGVGGGRLSVRPGHLPER